jgi:Sybindin-like family
LGRRGIVYSVSQSDRQTETRDYKLYPTLWVTLKNDSKIQILSGIKFVLNTDVTSTSTSVKELLQQLYAKVFVEYAVKNPLWTPGTPIQSSLFKTKLDEFIKNSPIFGLKNV